MSRAQDAERSAGAAPLDVELLENVIRETRRFADRPGEWAAASAREYARLLEAAPSSSALPSLDVEPEEEEGDDEGDIETFSPPRPQWPVPPTDGEDR